MKKSDIYFQNTFLVGLIALHVEGGWELFFGIAAWCYVILYLVALWREQ